ncbi:hypothetical protein [Microseira wollei]|uniref:Cytochrome b6-f complex subunit 7 n=1 Tax=Microseira wollei NIES-4236 TaxID=2530354 RepID=A0AAV3XCC9_9CYAN|nr:hypothetical protein [Microseira wollei]GET39046.1 hypothetical protein MiSe_38070 [Microseira wollei NIES-4236]
MKIISIAVKRLGLLSGCRCQKTEKANREVRYILKRSPIMETTNLLDLVTGGLALAILIGGLLMLFFGVSAFGDKDK